MHLHDKRGNSVDTDSEVDIEKVYLATTLNQGNHKPSKTI